MRKFKFGILVFVVSLVIIIIGIVGKWETHYKIDGIVTKVTGESIIIEDFSGNAWNYDSAEFHVGDVVEMTMFDRGGSAENDIILEIDMK